MKEEEVLGVLKRTGALITDDHVVYTSGKHGSTYINKDMVFANTSETSYLCHAIAKHFGNDRIETVLGPAVGGAIMAQWIARHLSTMNDREVFSVYAEKREDSFLIKRGYDKFIYQKRILVVEDILTTGRSAQKVSETAMDLGGKLIGLGALFNRNKERPNSLSFIDKFFVLLSMELHAWEESFCPLCKKGVPINNEVGKGDVL